MEHNLLSSLKLNLCPDVLERLGDTDIFATCSYLLDTSNRERAGTVGLTSASSSARGVGSVSLTCEVSCDAVFDGRWAPDAASSSTPLFCAATAQAGISLFALRDGELTSVSTGVVGCDAKDDVRSSLSLLSVDWMSGSDNNNVTGVSLATGLSDGRIWFGEVDDRGAHETQSFRAHSLGDTGAEVWTVAVCPHTRNVVWSGGDDAKLRAWDSRATCASPLFTSSVHKAGVTSITWCPLPGGEHLVATGGYDDHLLIWDDRVMGSGLRSLPLSDTLLGGGVWKVRWRPNRDEGTGAWANAIAVACMYDGVAILDTKPLMHSGGPLPILTKYTQHESITYGVAWVPSPKGQCASILSSSFYDHALHLWEVAGSDGEG